MSLFNHHNFSQEYRENTQPSNSKVYINPNFNLIKRPMPKSPLTHDNLNYSSKTRKYPSNNDVSKSKIYVNPNFIRSTNSSESNLFLEAHNSTQVNARSTVTFPVNVAKSRYSIVRHNNENKAEIVTLPPVTKSLKVNKYKSVSMQYHIKKNFETAKYLDKTSLRVQKDIKSTASLITPNVFESRFKLIKVDTQSISDRTEIKQSVSSKLSSSTSKLLIKSNKAKIKINKRKFKKNNIPCPLFKKYGKCLRNVLGNCEFLHDKKHVSVCRKFLKGICHDIHCLLSHEVTAEKMPTCSFYLRGMCTKDECPYLHVKLNEKTKICTDFLKGYCEKGGKCLNRHINICPDLAIKGTCLKKHCSFPHTINRVVKQKKNLIKTKVLNQNYSQTRVTKSKIDKETKKETNASDCRYYKDITDNISTSTTSEVIKPTRCKLGTLPSFIQL